MKKLMLWILALAGLSGGALFAQDITGTWQGTLQAGKQELRTVVKISKADAGSLKAVFYSIDQSGQGVAGAIALQGSTVKISVPSIGGTYEGKLSADGDLDRRRLDAGSLTDAPEPEACHRGGGVADSGASRAAEADGTGCRPRCLKWPPSSQADPKRRAKGIHGARP